MNSSRDPVPDAPDPELVAAAEAAASPGASSGPEAPAPAKAAAKKGSKKAPAPRKVAATKQPRSRKTAAGRKAAVKKAAVGEPASEAATTAAVVAPLGRSLRPTADDLWLIGEGRHERLWDVLGAHPGTWEGVEGTAFAVWAPNARAVWVVGEWTGWDTGAHPLERLDGGVWWGFVPHVARGAVYKFDVEGADGRRVRHMDPMAQFSEHSGGMASIVFDSRHEWGDQAWMEQRRGLDPLRDRMSVYEVHLGSWRRHEDGRFLTYRELASQLADHACSLGFTHVELMPPAEHPYEPSWGYQVTGFYAPTSRFGDPDEFRWFVDHLHQRGLGVIVDWVPAHFPKDEWGLARFDGTPLYEHADPRRAEHPDWGTLEFDHSSRQVRNFLVANALFWLGELHVDGLRVDAVASMLYLDYSRDHGQWSPNALGGHEDLDAVSFLQELNTVVHRAHPGVLTIAEESTAWNGVSRPVDAGGLGFTHKWNMGWMHDSLEYWSHDPIHRPWHHNQLTFGLTYAWSEHFVLPLSHDEVVHLKRPLLGKMPGSDDDRFANLRALYAWMWAHPGKQLLFMGAELAEQHEWSHDRSLDWDLLQDARHAGVTELVRCLNEVEARHPALYAGDGDPAGFAWLDVDRAEQSTLAFERRAPGTDDLVVCVANLSGIAEHGYRIGLDGGGRWGALLTTDDSRFGGGGGWKEDLEADEIPMQGRSHSAVLALPPLSVTFLAPRR
ncbi:MAG: 1,4-alpha-glucan branching protein GlgB [Acidimicrobiales bacterium]|nr:1,4-alpha-glucan branching protein GlgB [Acidimicrobiales bacterium]